METRWVQLTYWQTRGIGARLIAQTKIGINSQCSGPFSLHWLAAVVEFLHLKILASNATYIGFELQIIIWLVRTQ